MRHLGVLAALAFFVATPGTALANGLDLPDGWEAEQEGTWLLGSLPADSWSQRIGVNVWGVYQTHYQFRLTTLAGQSQQLEPSGFKVYHHGIAGPDTSWVPFTASYAGVEDAVMWASGSPGSHGVSDYVWVRFAQGDIDNYPNSYNCTWTNTPAFVLQLQMYGYHYTDPTKTVKLCLNQEFYFDGTNWSSGTSQSQPSPSYGSGASPGSVGVWNVSQPLPEPVTIVGMLLGVGGLVRYVRGRRAA